MNLSLCKRCLPVLAILALALPIRMIGIKHGAPKQIHHPDVRKQVIVAHRVYRGETNPHKIYPNDKDPENFQLTLYPYGTAYMAGKGAHLIAKLQHGNRYAFEGRKLFFWAYMLRIMNTASFSVALILFLFLLHDTFKPIPLIITGLLLALEPFHAQYSHYGMNDIPMLSVLLMAWVTASYIKGNAWQKYGLSILTGLLLGAGLGIKYQAVIGLMFPGFIWLDWLCSKRWKEVALSGTATLIAFIIGTSMTSPLLWQEPGYFFATLPEFMHWQSHILRYRNVTGEIYNMSFGPKVIRNFLWCMRHYISSGLVIFFPALIWGTVVCKHNWRKHPKFQLIISSLSFFLFMNLVVICCRDMMRHNDLLISTPFLIVLFGLFLSEYTEKWSVPGQQWKKNTLLAACCTIVVSFLATSIQDSFAFTRTDTRQLAKSWCKENIKPGSVIIRERYTMAPRIKGVNDCRLSFLSHDAVIDDAVKKGYFHYLMSSSIAHNRFLDPLSPYHNKEAKEFYETMAENYTLLADFEDRTLYFTHPKISIYQKRKR